jgi:hypothetical protein
MSEPYGTDGLGESLTRTLHRAAGIAPSPPPDLARVVTAQYARRRGSMVALAAALAVLVVLAAGVGLIRVVDHPAPVANPNVPSGLAGLGTVRTLPDRLNGVAYDLVHRLPDGRFLVRNRDVGAQQLLVVTVPKTGALTSRVLATLGPPLPSGRSVYRFDANDRWAAWVLPDKGGPDGSFSVYSLRLTDGSQPRKVLTLPARVPVLNFAVAGDRIYYQAGPKLADPLMFLPAAGGTAVEVPGTVGPSVPFSIPKLVAPWYIWQQQFTPTPAGGYAPVTMVNVETGARRTVRFPATDGQRSCASVWCVSQNADGTVFVQRSDGTGRHAFPGMTTVSPSAGTHDRDTDDPFLRDRYLVAVRTNVTPQQLVLLDAETGKVIPVDTQSAEGRPIEYASAGPDYLAWAKDGVLHLLTLR